MFDTGAINAALNGIALRFLESARIQHEKRQLVQAPGIAAAPMMGFLRP
jgi:hypothetical protein